MSCCIGVARLAWSKEPQSPDPEVYSKTIKNPLDYSIPLMKISNSKNSLNAQSSEDDSKLDEDSGSMSSAVSVPPIPKSPKVFQRMKGNKQTNEMIHQPSYLVNEEYFHQKIATPSSSRDVPGSHHYKTSSSDSCYSKDELADVAGEIRFRPPTSQIPAMTCFNFDAKNNDEISFKRGSKVYVRQNHAHDDQYVYIELGDGRGGYAPKQFLQPVGTTPPIINASEVKKENPIGEGTFSKVYISTYKSEKYALKEYRELCFEKAKNEAEYLNVMDHNNIVKVFGLCQDPVFMLIELCEGDQLVNLIKRPGFNPPLRVLMNWASQVAEGLWHMHNRDIPICHGDIKPSNIMIKEKPCICENNYHHEESDLCSGCGFRRLSRLTLKLTDFGLARPSSSEKNSNNNLVGSPPYMAPEYIRDLKMTPKADVWSFGVLFWELLTKQTPHQEYANYGKASLMYLIGTKDLKPVIPNSCPKDQADLLEKCWELDDLLRATMGEIIEIIKEMPKTDPEYIMICETKQSSAKSVMDYLKKINLERLVFPKEPIPPKRKLKGVSKNDISNPTDFRTVLSVQPEGNNKFTIHDHEVDRQRHKSSHDYMGQGTLPRAGLKAEVPRERYVSTPDLSLDVSGKLERTNAVRRKTGKGGDQTVISCLTSLDDNCSYTERGPIAASTPMDNCNFDSNTIQIVDDRDLISVPAKSKKDSQKEKYSPKRSPSTNSNSTFYVSSDGGTITPTYDTATIKSGSSIESSNSKKSKRIFKNFAHHFKGKSQENHDVCYDSTTKKYHNLVNSKNIIQDNTNAELSPAIQIPTIPISQFNEFSGSRFTKFHDLPINQRHKKIQGHRKNSSNGSTNVFDITGRKTPPIFHQSSSESGLTPLTPKYLSGFSKGSISPGALSQVIPFPSSSSSPGIMDDEIRKRTSSYVDLRKMTTDFPVESDDYIMSSIMHSRSKSSEVNVRPENQKEILDALVNTMNKGKNKEQTIVENIGYVRMIKEPENTVNNHNADQNPYYTDLKRIHVTSPRIESKKNENKESSKPKNNILNTVIELPKNQAPPVPPRHHGPTINTFAYISPESKTSPNSSISSFGNSTNDQIPSSTAPVLSRPDTLNFNKPRTSTGIQRRENPYVQLATNFKIENNSSDVPSNRVPYIPKTIRHH